MTEENCQPISPSNTSRVHVGGSQNPSQSRYAQGMPSILCREVFMVRMTGLPVKYLLESM
jgi:hypothetical protein